jgi:glycosyltransferase involved in cell wall biosynthesis
MVDHKLGNEAILSVGASIFGHFSSPMGLGAAARRCARAFQSVNYPITLHNLRVLPKEGGVETADFSETPAQYRNLICCLNPPEMFRALGAEIAVLPQRHRSIGYWNWELPVLPPSWVPACNFVHEIWTPSQFGADLFRDWFAGPVRVIPYGVPETDMPQTEARERLGLPLDSFIFLMIYDSDSTNLRKNPEGVIAAFLDAFAETAESAPLLIIKKYGHTAPSAEMGRLIDEAQSRLPLIVMSEFFDEDKMSSLQSACDCYVSLHRSECFGLNIAECMSAGRLAIVTDFSGNRDFTKSDNSILVPYSPRVLKPHDYYYGRGQWWAEPDHEAAVEAMRWAVSKPQEARKLAQKAKTDIRGKFSFERVGKLMQLALSE